jgi:hypothetical protein
MHCLNFLDKRRIMCLGGKSQSEKKPQKEKVRQGKKIQSRMVKNVSKYISNINTDVYNSPVKRPRL